MRTVITHSMCNFFSVESNPEQQGHKSDLRGLRLIVYVTKCHIQLPLVQHVAVGLTSGKVAQLYPTTIWGLQTRQNNDFSITHAEE